ncbi:hypothetical protein TNCV_1263391 [Trichonephila clavipes]|nr:hypothetical protein TNCV_1263391 [Trichonephila clavipes]
MTAQWLRGSVLRFPTTERYVRSKTTAISGGYFDSKSWPDNEDFTCVVTSLSILVTPCHLHPSIGLRKYRNKLVTMNTQVPRPRRARCHPRCELHNLVWYWARTRDKPEDCEQQQIYYTSAFLPDWWAAVAQWLGYRTMADNPVALRTSPQPCIAEVGQGLREPKARFLPGSYPLTAMAGSDVVQSGRPIFDDFFQHLWPYIGNNTANVVFQMVKRLWLIRIDQ